MGWIQRRDGRSKPWRARYRGLDGKEHSKSFRRKVDADRWLRQEETKQDLGDWVDPSAGSIPYSRWSEQWIESLHGVKPKTKAGYESLLRSRVLPKFADVSLSRISPPMVRRWISDMVEEDLSAARIRQARQVLHASLQQAVVDGVIAKNPTDNVSAPPVRPRRQRFLAADEVARLAKAAEARQGGMGAFVLLLGWSGMRWGEATALRVRAIDVGARLIRIEEAFSEVDGKLVLGTPKTHETRTVIVPRPVMDRLDETIKGSGPDDLVFTAPMGGPLRVSNFRRDVWAPAVQASDVPDDLLVHDLRDTAASLMIREAGANIKAVQRQLGHASASMTLDVYGGLYRDELEYLADRLEVAYADL